MNATSEIDVCDFFSDFDSGSLLNLRKTGPGEFEFGLQPKSVHGEQGSLQVWFYGGCNMKGVRVSETDRLRMAVRPPHSLAKMRPVYSFDNESWNYVPEPYGPHEDSFRFELPLRPGARHVYFATHFPYPSSRVYQRIETIADIELVRPGVIGRTERGREIPCFEITSPTSNKSSKRRVMLSAGSHAGETASLWAMEGIIDFLLSGSDEAAEMLRRFVFNVVPMLNVDGAALGLDRRTATGVNLYFDYRDFKASESRAMWEYIKGVKPNVWLDLHSWHLGIAEGAYGPVPKLIGKNRFDSEIKPLLDTAGKHFPITKYGADNLDCPNTQALLQLSVPGFCPEFNMGLGVDGRWKTREDNKSLGVALLRGIADYLG